jgi:hypothetical protein
MNWIYRNQLTNNTFTIENILVTANDNDRQYRPSVPTIHFRDDDGNDRVWLLSRGKLEE